jgi:hypothetical protein
MKKRLHSLRAPIVRATVRPRSEKTPCPPSVVPGTEFQEWNGAPWPLDETDLPDAPPPAVEPLDADAPRYIGTFRALLRMGADVDPLDLEVRVSPFDVIEVGPLVLPEPYAKKLHDLLVIALGAIRTRTAGVA